MKTAILTIGDEILIGQIVDTNSAWIGQTLNDLGIRVNRIVSLSDSHQEIVNGITQAVDDHDIVFITGGLGPTKDDITKVALSDYLGVKMFFHQETFDRITRMFEKLGRPMSPHHHDQCNMPEGVEILRNSMGTAPGMWFDHKGKAIISMPGVPYEMKAIMTEEVFPRLKERYSLPEIHHYTIQTACTGETTIENLIGEMVSAAPNHIKVAYLPSLAAVRVRVSGYGNTGQSVKNEVNKMGEQIKAKLGDIVFGIGDTTLAQKIQELAISKGIKIGTAESCTGGNVARTLVAEAGSSAYFMGSIIAYDNQVKIDRLGVDSTILEKFGTVSEETVKAMVDGALQVLPIDIAVSISGIAGPTGGSDAKPVGTIWICVGNKDKKITYLLKTGKDRSKNIEITTMYALDQLRRFMEG